MMLNKINFFFLEITKFLSDFLEIKNDLKIFEAFFFFLETEGNNFCIFFRN